MMFTKNDFASKLCILNVWTQQKAICTLIFSVHIKKRHRFSMYRLSLQYMKSTGRVQIPVQTLEITFSLTPSRKV